MANKQKGEGGERRDGGDGELPEGFCNLQTLGKVLKHNLVIDREDITSN